MPSNDPILDVRPEEQFLAGHRAGAANIPLEELARRVHELPPAEVALVVFDADPARAAAACERLRRRRGPVEAVGGEEWLRSGPIEAGPSRVRLWWPHALLEEAMPLLRDAWGDLSERDAVDLACGTGRDATFLALAGLRVVAVDVLPDALARAADLARGNGAALETRQGDLVRGAGDLLAPCSFDLVVVFHFLHRPLLPAIREAVRPGGFVAYETFLEEQRVLHGRPRRQASLLRSGELRASFAGWDARIDREGPAGTERITAALVARKPELPG